MAWNEFIRDTSGGPTGSSTDPVHILIDAVNVTTWQAPVADVSALPLAGNQDGDVRITLDTYTLYIWNGAAWNEFTTTHNVLTGRDAVDAHPIAAITDLQNSLNAKVDTNTSVSFTLTGSTVQMIVNGNILQEWEIGGEII